MTISVNYPKAHLGKRFAALIIDDIISFVAPFIIVGLIFAFGCLVILVLVLTILLPILTILGESGIELPNPVLIIGSFAISFALIILILYSFKRNREQILRLFGMVKKPDFYIHLILLLIPSVYFFTKDGFPHGQSLGKRYMGLMVVDLTTNRPCTKSSSFLRGIVYILLCIPLGAGLLIEPLYAMIQNEGKRLGDLAAKTQVIDVKDFMK